MTDCSSSTIYRKKDMMKVRRKENEGRKEGRKDRRETQRKKETKTERKWCLHEKWEGWEVNLIKGIVEWDKWNTETERERMTEGVPLPCVQPLTLTSQTERHKTSGSPLSSSLDFHSHTLQRIFMPALRHAATLASTPAQPSAAVRRRPINSTPKHCTQATRKHLVSHSSLQQKDWNMLHFSWVMPNSVWSCRRELTGGKGALRLPTLTQTPSHKAADVTEKERRREKHNLPHPSFPHLGEQYSASSWRGSAFVPLPTLPLKSAEQTDALTHWPAAVRGEDGAKQSLHSTQFESVLGQLLSDSQCECVFPWMRRLYLVRYHSTGLIWRPRTTNAAPLFASARPLWPLSVPGITGQYR